jgi:2,3-bisphosphoglycerate-independent phosphoglycerate mutase
MFELKRPIGLVILDGWGHSNTTQYNAIARAEPQHFLEYWNTYPSTYLQAAGESVGTLPGYMGNSEIGHMTIGAGRIIEQSLATITYAIEDGTFFKNDTLVSHLKQCARSNATLHICGLLSDGGIHSHEKHLYAIIAAAAHTGIQKLVVHPFLDGRDVPPQSAEIYVHNLEKILQKHNIGMIGSIVGRYYAMDRDWNWYLTTQTYNLLTQNRADNTFDTWQEALRYYYEKDITDEFIPPTCISNAPPFYDNDALLFFNFRPDRMRQLTALFCQKPVAPQGDIKTGTEKSYAPYPPNPPKPVSYLWIITMVPYHPSFTNPTLYDIPHAKTTLFDILQKHNYSLFTIAETEKYAHVTYFFNGGQEAERPNETRRLIPSLDVRSYAEAPEMSAPEITETVVQSLTTNPRDFYLINYANADMVAHSGNIESTVEAITCLDQQLKQLHDAFLAHGGTLIITSDHGNAEYMFDPENNTRITSHTTNPVPCIVIQEGLTQDMMTLPYTGLAGITPFILQSAGLEDEIALLS